MLTITLLKVALIGILLFWQPLHLSFDQTRQVLQTVFFVVAAIKVKAMTVAKFNFQLIPLKTRRKLRVFSIIYKLSINPTVLYTKRLRQMTHFIRKALQDDLDAHQHFLNNDLKVIDCNFDNLFD